ncbi:hypothetical protein AB0H42_18635 [Nocardia sp. NPDC050799]|uniref:hypothetical protein n=1 Tax=Nocardia sp. NPDC050799 TaxID=3154842 RepID=UPI0033F0C064
MDKELERLLKHMADRLAGMADRPGIPQAGEAVAGRYDGFGTISNRAADGFEETDVQSATPIRRSVPSASSGEAGIPPKPGPSEPYGWMSDDRWRQHVLEKEGAPTAPVAPRQSPANDIGRAEQPTHTDQAPPVFSSDPIDSVVADRQSVDWNTVVGNNRVVLLGENHANTPIRDFLTGQARAMKEAGITHYGIEAPAHPAFDELNAGRPVDLTGVNVGPFRNAGYEQTIRAMSAEGIKIVPLDLDQSVPLAAGARDSHMADTITGIVSQNPDAKVTALLGSFHTADMAVDGQPAAGAILHASSYPTTTVGFIGGTETTNMLATAARNNNAAGETFFADLRDYHDAGGNVLRQDDAVIHLPQSASPGGSSGWGGGFGGNGGFDFPLGGWS